MQQPYSRFTPAARMKPALIYEGGLAAVRTGLPLRGQACRRAAFPAALFPPAILCSAKRLRLSRFPFDDKGIKAPLASVLFVKALGTRLCTKIEHGRRVFPGKLQQLAADALFLMFRQNKQLRDGPKIVSVRQNS